MAERNYDYSIKVFKEGTPPSKKRWYTFFVIYFILCVLAEVWPIFLIANRVRPYILGLPFSMFWTVLMVVLGFVGMIFLYRFEYKGED